MVSLARKGGEEDGGGAERLMEPAGPRYIDPAAVLDLLRRPRNCGARKPVHVTSALLLHSKDSSSTDFPLG